MNGGIDRIDLSDFDIKNVKALKKAATKGDGVITYDLPGHTTLEVHFDKGTLSAKDFILWAR